MYEKYKGMLSVEDRGYQGEVSTPLKLVNEMLDKLPEEVFINKSTTFLDPGFGNGTFLIEIVKRLRKQGHSMENIQERVYGCEISHRLYNKVTKLFSNYNFRKLYKEDFLTKDFNNMKFDVIIGNPPYQSTEDGSMRKKAWVLFSEKAMELSKIVAFVTPNAWQKTSKYFKPIGEKIKMHLVDYSDVNKHFKVGEDIGYWIYDKSKEPIEFIDPNPFLPIYNKVVKDEKTTWHYRDFQLPWVVDKSTKEKVDLTKEPTDTHTVPVYWTAKQVRYAEEKDIKYKGWKVVINNSGTYYKADDPDRYAKVTDTLAVGLGAWGIKVESEEEGKNMLTWIHSKLYRVLVLKMKTGGFNNPFVELINLGGDKKWTDETIYEYFNLSEEEVNLIESTVA